MAEWTGRKRTLNSIDPAGEPPAYAASDHLPPPPAAPGATSSPQLPGETPDQPDLPGRTRGTLPPLASNRRPLTEYETAQRRLRLFTPAPGTELVAADWEQGPAPQEELRKADLTLGTPFRPLPRYGLGIGRAGPALTAAVPLEVIEEAVDITGEALPPATPVAATAVAEVEAPPTEIPAGAIRGDGTTACPDGFPIKGNAQSRIYHAPESRVYGQTVAEICFATPEAAEAAGYRSPRNP